MKYVDINKGIKEGWLHKVSTDKAKQFLYGSEKFVSLMNSMLEAGFIEMFWSDRCNDLIVCNSDKLKEVRD